MHVSSDQQHSASAILPSSILYSSTLTSPISCSSHATRHAVLHTSCFWTFTRGTSHTATITTPDGHEITRQKRRRTLPSISKPKLRRWRRIHRVRTRRARGSQSHNKSSAATVDAPTRRTRQHILHIQRAKTAALFLWLASSIVSLDMFDCCFFGLGLWLVFPFLFGSTAALYAIETACDF